jgi:biofilm protein TabA
MVIDNITNASVYHNVHPLFKQAFDYIHSTDLLTIEVGKYQIAEGLTAIFSDKMGVSVEASSAEFECHDRNIDIQLCIRGNEKIGWKPRNTCTSQKGDYNAEKDVLFYEDAPDMFFQLTDHQFVIFFPHDVHAPMINVDDRNIRKLVIKVRK